METKKKSAFSKLMEFAGNHKYFSYISCVLAVISAWVALIPFYDVWCIIKEVLEVRPDFSKAVSYYLIRLAGGRICTACDGILYRITYVFAQSGIQGTGKYACVYDGAYNEAATWLCRVKGHR